ncbi:DUF3021 family protein [Ruminiclostridium papyrosolvens]|uniref:DUF3021 domain-containing protein n=1 Tax=Ruminiclostridium papyrosolvens C7 TaxID=1330534 RepID=U4R0D6_9FIRM|nr:DUF3021 family protein [Ruminiclostridium papyrosolvens]EPR11478.1 hypothetical protein L323_11760 [Ruminiclostridium papyrosolvens C7]
MSHFKTFLKRCLLEYFIITTCITAATAVLGLTLDPTAKFGYESYFSPLLFGFISIIPSFLTYSQKELSFRQTVIRKVLHVIVLEAVLIVVGFQVEILRVPSDALIFAVAVFIVNIAVNFISWKLDQKNADDINKKLKSLQGRS